MCSTVKIATCSVNTKKHGMSLGDYPTSSTALDSLHTCHAVPDIGIDILDIKTFTGKPLWLLRGVASVREG